MVDAPILPPESGRPDDRRGRGYLMVAVAAALFAVNGIVSKVVLLGSDLSSLELTQIRSTGAAAGLLVFLLAFARARLRVARRELLFLVLFGVTGVAFVQWLYFVAIEQIPVGIALLLQFLAPLLVALFARFVYREHIRQRIWVALILCISGVGVIVEIWSGVAFDTIGITAAFAASFALAAYILMAERERRHRDPVSLSFYGFLFAALFWAAVQPVWQFPWDALQGSTSLRGNLSEHTAPIWLLLAFVVVVGTMITFSLLTGALRHISATRASIVATFEPVLATAIAWLWLGETFGTAQLLGGAVVLTGILLAQTAR
ncbi:MAG: EamA family transporter [Actinobacteria bacterium]|nr:EamA family transporter [Actinomycetota bacterium]